MGRAIGARFLARRRGGGACGPGGRRPRRGPREVAGRRHASWPTSARWPTASSMVATTVERHGRLDVLVTAAGVWVEGPSSEMTEEQWDRTIDVNLKGTFFACRSAIPALVASAGASWRSRATTDWWVDPAPPSTARTKFGVNGLVRSLALELAPQGVRVNSVCPADVDTPMLAGRLGTSRMATRPATCRPAGHAPPGRPGSVHHVPTRSRPWSRSFRRTRRRPSPASACPWNGASPQATDPRHPTPRLSTPRSRPLGLGTQAPLLALASSHGRVLDRPIRGPLRASHVGHVRVGGAGTVRGGVASRGGLARGRYAVRAGAARPTTCSRSCVQVLDEHGTDVAAVRRRPGSPRLCASGSARLMAAEEVEGDPEDMVVTTGRPAGPRPHRQDLHRPRRSDRGRGAGLRRAR